MKKDKTTTEIKYYANSNDAYNVLKLMVNDLKPVIYFGNGKLLYSTTDIIYSVNQNEKGYYVALYKL